MEWKDELEKNGIQPAEPRFRQKIEFSRLNPNFPQIWVQPVQPHFFQAFLVCQENV